MATAPDQKTGAAAGAETDEQKFRRLACAWRAATAYVSSTSDLVDHPTFREIVGMGPDVIPLLLRELERRSGPWHRALSRITGVNPVPPADRGSLNRAAEAWLRWGREQGYRSLGGRQLVP